MTVEEIYSMLSTTGLEVAYFMFPVGEAPDLPYIVYYFPNNDDFIADDKNYVNINALNVELYTEQKDFDTEALLEEIFHEHNLVYTKTESYLDSEHMYEVLYEMEVLING